jgi:hypothetical protein
MLSAGALHQKCFCCGKIQFGGQFLRTCVLLLKSDNLFLYSLAVGGNVGSAFYDLCGRRIVLLTNHFPV